MAHVKSVGRSDCGRCGARSRGDYEGLKKWVKNDVIKKMQRGDHCEGLVVLVPMVETVRKTDSVWVQNGQTKKGSTDYK